MFNTTQPFVYLYAMYVRIIRSFNIGYFIVNFGYKYLPALIQITFVDWLTPLNFNYCLDNDEGLRYKSPRLCGLEPVKLIIVLMNVFISE